MQKFWSETFFLAKLPKQNAFLAKWSETYEAKLFCGFEKLKRNKAKLFLFRFKAKLFLKQNWDTLRPQPFSLFPRPHICIVILCAQWRLSIYSLFVPTMASRIQSNFDFWFFISPWLELKWQLLFVPFSTHICVNGENDYKPLCNATLFTEDRTLFSYASPYRLCFKTKQWNWQIKAKPS